MAFTWIENIQKDLYNINLDALTELRDNIDSVQDSLANATYDGGVDSSQDTYYYSSFDGGVDSSKNTTVQTAHNVSG